MHSFVWLFSLWRAPRWGQDGGPNVMQLHVVERNHLFPRLSCPFCLNQDIRGEIPEPGGIVHLDPFW